ncbi:uncharacterized protein KY384_008097 [Bacidia gigantensis]|uniref:uncharacterized protein n=1 Tax=Bacidia gigantensis TaxID=2732470 RepID=UPI001D047954|nr:uncharacterized protein KY384_008097 [Bacidia gigantensis]KAG8526668.1 hypothetical protein KY384_008097 [Bacidia gigantensis]
MLPEFLAGSYKRYKQDTALFTTWLAKAAASCGYKPNATEKSTTQHTGSTAKIASDQDLGTSTSSKTGYVPSATGRLKGKDRKAAKALTDQSIGSTPDTPDTETPASTVKYTVTTEELLRQADAIANSDRKMSVQMPASLYRIVQHAIRARQRCSEWFQNAKIRNEHFDKGHTHFVKILQRALEILEPCVVDETAAKKPKDQAKESPKESEDLTNRFSALNMEESPEIDAFEIAEVVAAVHAPQKTKASKGKAIATEYELEDEEEFDADLAFIVYCFFEDLHRTQDFLSDLWRKYMSGKCDLHTAAVTTNAAFELVRQAEEDLIKQAPKAFNKTRSWDTIAIVIFYADAFERGVCPEGRLGTSETLRITPFDDFIYLSTARILMKFTFMANLPPDCGMPYPLPCQPLRFGYISRPELLGTPEMDKREHEDLILSRLIMDRDLWNTCTKTAGEYETTPPPHEDEFSKGLDKLMSKGTLSIAVVFAARILLDIQDVLGAEVGRGHQDLVRTTKEIDKMMNLKVVNGMWDVGGSGERWHERDVGSVMRIKLTSIYWILDNPANAFPKFKEIMLAKQSSQEGISFNSSGANSAQSTASPRLGAPPKSKASQQAPVSVKKPPKDPKFSTISAKVHQIPDGVDFNDPDFQEVMRKKILADDGLDDGPMDPVHEENARRLDLKPISPSPDLNYLFTFNPIYCGLVSFNMLTDFEASGIALCNWHKSIWPSAHLYHALRQTSSISKPWPEMEELMDLHMDSLFAGCLPLSAYEFHVRFGLALGLSITNFARNPRRRTDGNRAQIRQGANGIKLRVTEMSSVFRQYFDNKSSFETCLVKLENLLRKPSSSPSKSEKQARKRPLTTLQFLRMLEEDLPRVARRLQFDYITLTKQCVKLLKTIRQQIELNFQVAFPRVPTEDSADQTLTWIVMQALEENSDLASAQNTLHQRTQPQTPTMGHQLTIAHSELQKFLSTYNPQALIKTFNALNRPQTLPTGLPNHWNISIRHVPLSPPGDLVFFVQPDSHFVHTEGPIQTVEGQAPGHKLNPKSLVTLQTIARMIMKAFVEGMGVGMSVGVGVGGGGIGIGLPLSWKTNEPNFARRIGKVMEDMGVRADLVGMEVAGEEEGKCVDGDWDRFLTRLTTGRVG